MLSNAEFASDFPVRARSTRIFLRFPVLMRPTLPVAFWLLYEKARTFLFSLVLRIYSKPTPLRETDNSPRLPKEMDV